MHDQNELQRQIGSRVASLLERSGMNRGVFAERTGMGLTYVSEIINGKRNLTLGMIARMEQALGARIIDVVEPDAV